MLVGPGASRLMTIEEETKRRFLLVFREDVAVNHFEVLGKGTLESLVGGDARAELEGKQVDLKLGEVGRHDVNAGVGKLDDGLTVVVGSAARMVGKRTKVRIERVLDGVAYASLVGGKKAPEEPITAESAAEKPTRKPPAKKQAEPAPEPDAEAQAEEGPARPRPRTRPPRPRPRRRPRPRPRPTSRRRRRPGAARAAGAGARRSRRPRPTPTATLLPSSRAPRTARARRSTCPIPRSAARRRPRRRRPPRTARARASSRSRRRRPAAAPAVAAGAASRPPRRPATRRPTPLRTHDLARW